jgi:hypothetical protein
MLAQSKPITFDASFSFDSDRDATRCHYVEIDIANENLMSFLEVFKLFHACVCHRLEYTLIYYHPNNL